MLHGECRRLLVHVSYFVLSAKRSQNGVQGHWQGPLLAGGTGRRHTVGISTLAL